MKADNASRIREFALVLAAQIVSVIGGFAGLKLLSNLFTPEQFGIYQLGWSVALMGGLVLFGPIGQSIIRAYANAREADQTAGFFAYSLRLTFKTAFVLIVLMIGAGLVASGYAAISPLYLIASIAGLAGLGIATVFHNYQVAMRDRIFFIVSQFVISFLRPAAAACAILLVAQSDQALAGLFLSGGILALFALVQFTIIRRRIHRLKHSPEPAAKPDHGMRAIAAGFIYTGAIGVFSLYGDRWVLSGLTDTAAVGVYAAIFQIALAPLFFAQGLLIRFSMPLVYAKAAKGGAGGAAAQRNTTQVLLVWLSMVAIMLPVAWLLDSFIVRLLTNETIARDAGLLPILLAGLALERFGSLQIFRGAISMRTLIYIVPRLIHVALLFSIGYMLFAEHGIYAFGYAHIIAGAAFAAASLIVNRMIRAKEEVSCQPNSNQKETLPMAWLLTDHIHSKTALVSDGISFDKPLEPGGESGVITLHDLLLEGYNRFVPYESGKFGIPDDLLAQMPTRCIIENMKGDAPPDLIGLGGGDIPIVSQRVKDKLEALEPGAHDFFPITLVSRRTAGETELPGTYYLVYVWQRPDIIDHDETAYDEECLGGLDHARLTLFWFSKLQGDYEGKYDYFHLINFRPPGHRGHHLWRASAGRDGVEPRKDPESGVTTYPDPATVHPFFISDDFAEFIRRDGITGSVPLRIVEKPLKWLHDRQHTIHGWSWVDASVGSNTSPAHRY